MRRKKGLENKGKKGFKIKNKDQGGEIINLKQKESFRASLICHEITIVSLKREVKRWTVLFR